MDVDVDVRHLLQTQQDEEVEGVDGAKGQRHPLPDLRMRVSERKVLLFLVDAFIVNGALLAAVVLRTDLRVSTEAVPILTRWFVVLTAVWWFWAIFFDAYDLAVAASGSQSVRSAGTAALATAITYTLIPVLTPALHSRLLLFLFTGLALGGIMAWRAAYAKVFSQPYFKQRALVVGAGWAGRTLAEALQGGNGNPTNPFRGTGYDLLGFVDDNGDYAGQSFEGVPVLGDGGQLVALAEGLRVDEIIVAITHRHAINDGLFDALLRCRELGYRMVTMSTLYERLLGRVPVDHIGRDLHMVMPMEEAAGERLYGLAKRGLDIVAGALGLAAMGVCVPFVAAFNALACPGPLFYRQTRVGWGGREFEMLKFRSMIPDAEAAEGAVWACAGDARVTPIGRFMRKTRLDELPQMWNVLKGEMSVIGPRPERPEFVEELAQALPFYRARHAVRPGITGWAQVRFNYGNSVEDAKVKLEYDIYYVKHVGPFLDLRIALQTVWVMLGLRGT